MQCEDIKVISVVPVILLLQFFVILWKTFFLKEFCSVFLNIYCPKKEMFLENSCQKLSQLPTIGKSA
jgi:hypothetical protein